jgi:tripartite-type tricarboxylate transporter receptor subunit TctC
MDRPRVAPSMLQQAANPMLKHLLCIVLLASASGGVRAAGDHADVYPSKPIRIVIGFPPGGGVDYMARLIGSKLSEHFGQPVIVDNRPGASSNLASEMAARANPDGYTLLLGVSVGLASSRSLYPKLGYDLLKDFSYISVVATGTNVLLAHPSLAAQSVAQLVSLARSKPGAIRYGSSGVASPDHLTMELLQRHTGVEFLHVPYKGGPNSVVAIAAGEVDIAFASVAAALPMIQSKRLNALAVASAKRLGALPGVPTVAESGIAEFDVTNTFGIIAPARAPDAVVKRLNAELRGIVQMGDVRAKFAAQGLEAAASTPGEFRAVIEAETEQWARVIKDARIVAN